MKKKVPVAVWLIITFVIFALLAWWAYMMLNHVRNDASGAYTITTQVAEGEGTVTPAKEKAGAKGMTSSSTPSWQKRRTAEMWRSAPRIPAGKSLPS